MREEKKNIKESLQESVQKYILLFYHLIAIPIHIYLKGCSNTNTSLVHEKSTRTHPKSNSLSL